MTMLRSIELRKFRRDQTFTTDGDTFKVRFGVYFDEMIDRDHGNSLLNQEPYHCIIHEWLRANCRDPYLACHVMSSYVLFEHEDEAILCHMAFSGNT